MFLLTGSVTNDYRFSSSTNGAILRLYKASLGGCVSTDTPSRRTVKTRPNTDALKFVEFG